MTDDMRKAFEAQAQEFGLLLERSGVIPDVYAYTITEIAWAAWQAATMLERERAANVCEGHKLDKDAWTSWAYVNDKVLDECAAAIRKG